MSELVNIYDKTTWIYRKVEDDDLSNRNLEVIISFYDKNKFELNINKFFSKFFIDIETFFDIPDEEQKDNKISDDVFQSDYHHSLIIGKYKVNENQNILLIIEKIFTNQESKFNENQKNVKLFKNEDGNLIFEKDSIFYNFKNYNEEIVLKLSK